MKKRLLVLFAVVCLMVGVAHAHNGMIHVMGTVAAVKDTTLSVKTTDGKTQDVVLTPTTKYVRMGKAVTQKDIQTGDHVVVEAAKKDNQLIAAEVKLGMAGMQGMKM